jgi:hypothetical protein
MLVLWGGGNQTVRLLMPHSVFQAVENNANPVLDNGLQIAIYILRYEI